MHIATKPLPRPLKPPGNSLTIKSPTQVLGSPINTQANARRQTTNQATDNDNRGSGKTQLIPSSIKSSSGLSTKARIAIDMAKGLASFGQSKPKYQGLSMRKNTNPLGESGSSVTPLTTNLQPSLDSSQQTLLPRSSHGHNGQANQTQATEVSSPRHSPSLPLPPQQEELPHAQETDPMDVDQLEFVDFLHFCRFFDLLQPACPLLNQRTLQQRKIYYTR